MSGLTVANVSILKTGKARAIRFSTLEAICRELGRQPGDVLEHVSEPDHEAGVPYQQSGGGRDVTRSSHLGKGGPFR